MKYATLILTDDLKFVKDKLILRPLHETARSIWWNKSKRGIHFTGL